MGPHGEARTCSLSEVMPALELKPMAVTTPPNMQAMMALNPSNLAAMMPKAKDLVMTYPRTPVPPPFQSLELPAEVWPTIWDLTRAQIVAEMEQSEQHMQAFTSDMPSMDPLSMFKDLFKDVLLGGMFSISSKRNDAMTIG